MNCKRCGGTLVFVERGGFFRCEFCSTVHIAADQEISADRVVRIGETVDEYCPVCEIPLVTGAMEGIRIRYCEDCHGILLPIDDFFGIIKKRRTNYQDLDVIPSPIDPEELKRRIRCPQCHQSMDTHPYHGPGNAVIDSCHRCKLLWFDHAEIAALEKAPGRR